MGPLDAMTPTATPRRRVLVDPERLPGWFDRFAARHGLLRFALDDGQIAIDASDAAHAWLDPIWEPISPDAARDPAAVAEYYARDRRVGALIVHRSAHAVGIFDGTSLVTGRHDSHYVQGRTKKGGWSQQRYARRRDNQAGRAMDEAADDVTAILLPEAGRLDALVAGGDSRAVRAVLAEPAFAGLRALLARPVIAVPDPNQTVLRAFATTFRKVPIELDEAAQSGSVTPDVRTAPTSGE